MTRLSSAAALAGCRARLRSAILFAACFAFSPSDALAQRPPNIVLVLMDDMGYGDLESYGANDIRTPGIDRLAKSSPARLSYRTAGH